MPIPAVVLIDDTTILGDHVQAAMTAAGLTARRTHWDDADLADALGIIAIQRIPCGEPDAAIAQAVRDWRLVLDAASMAHARCVCVHHAGALGHQAGTNKLDAGSFHRPDADRHAYYDAPYAAEHEVYRYIEAGVHVVPLVVGFCIDPEAGDDWGVSASVGQPRVRMTHQIDVTDAAGCGRGIVTALQSARSGRRYVLGGVPMSAESCLDHLVGSDETVEIPSAAFASVEGIIRRIAPEAVDAIQPLIRGEQLDSDRAKAELGYRPRSPF